ncbi:cell division cycle 7-related protein kinase-like isoform X1 [Danaus plexippus]|uniref:cell division cycle 7-related protein kinase-like isoform X1 n=1 Tax=Danaus plexippus TaxID=13037 RepID=UPI002AB11437|nr:cell division cycle 7-related protein kinase-like isoform X1 [Danaus plexippus]
MSRIRGIEAKVQKEIEENLENRRNKYKEVIKKKNDICTKVDSEKLQIVELLYKLPKLDKIFDVHRKIGEGTFSSVYLGSLKQHAQLPDDQKRWFAIKHLVPTAHPARIEHELRCLQDIGGKDYVIGVDLCLRHLDTIVFVMPYIPHRKFSEYVGDMDADEVRCYMRALLVALRHVHSFGVIHRDVKPSNFLYDRENRRYLLVDFGLAQRVVSDGPSPPVPPPAHANSLKRPREEVATISVKCVIDENIQSEKRFALDLSTRSRSTSSAAQSPKKVSLPKVQISKQKLPKVSPGVCSCSNAGSVCSPCGARAAARAPRAGTQGFRPPEVLLKSPRQGPAVDTWAAGVVLASMLTARYPFFRASDDASALAELADLLGTLPLQRTAASLGRRMVTSQPRRGLCLRKLAARLRGGAPPGPPPPALPACEHCHLPLPHCLCRDETVKATSITPNLTIAGFPDEAFSLAARLLDPDPRARATAQDALTHPFLAD